MTVREFSGGGREFSSSGREFSRPGREWAFRPPETDRSGREYRQENVPVSAEKKKRRRLRPAMLTAAALVTSAIVLTIERDETYLSTTFWSSADPDGLTASQVIFRITDPRGDRWGGSGGTESRRLFSGGSVIPSVRHNDDLHGRRCGGLRMTPAAGLGFIRRRAMRPDKRRILRALLALVMGASLLAGCQRTKSPEAVEGAAFAMDTAMRFTLYSEDPASAQGVLAVLTSLLGGLDSMLSATAEDSDVAQVNRSGGRPVEVSAWTRELLPQVLALCEATGGALDVTAYPAVKAWGFTTGEHRVPPPDELAELAASIDYTAVKVEKNTVTVPAGMEIDLGAAAKGYAGDLLARNVRENGISSALLDLGQSTIVAVGGKPDGSPWRIGVRDPDGDGYFAVVELEDMAIGTSGGYQRYFEQDGVAYWHILDPKTAAPARSGLASVSVVSPSALVCDGLSTALFVMGLEEGAQFWRDHPELDFQAVFVTENGSVYRTAGLAESFSLAAGYEGRSVSVLE